jgi:hypothetical protein
VYGKHGFNILLATPWKRYFFVLTRRKSFSKKKGGGGLFCFEGGLPPFEKDAARRQNEKAARPVNSSPGTFIEISFMV